MNKPIQIHSENYEAWFLLLVDGALTPGETKAVLDFVEANPDLKTELDLLQMTKSEADCSIGFNNKKSLYKVTEETVLLYLDNELEDIENNSDLEWAIHQHPDFAILKQTYNQPDTSIIFENKERLLMQNSKSGVRKFGANRRRSTPHSIGEGQGVSSLLPNWLKIAAAAVITGALIFLVVLNPFSKKSSTESIAKLSGIADTGNQVVAQSIPEIKPTEVIQDDKQLVQGAIIPESEDAPNLVKNNIETNRTKYLARATHSEIMNRNQPINSDLVNSKEKIIVEQTAIKEIPKLPNTKITHVIPAMNIDSKIETTQTIVANVQTINSPSSIDQPVKNQRKFYKNLGDNIKNRVVDVLANGDDEITVAGFAINISK